MNVYIGAMSGSNQDEGYDKIVKLLEPISRAAAERMSITRAASHISYADLKLVRMYLATKLGLDEHIMTLLRKRPLEGEKCWSVLQVHLCIFAPFILCMRFVLLRVPLKKCKVVLQRR